MQRRTVVGILMVLAAAAALAMVASCATAETLGNAATDRGMVDVAWVSDFGFCDVGLENPLTGSGFWQLGANWHIFVDCAQPLTQTENIDLMIWRHIAGDQYELIVRDNVAVQPGNGVQDIPVGQVAKTALLQPGDFTGFYIPLGITPVISVDFDATVNTDPFYMSAASWAVGDRITCSYAGARQYSLNVDVVPSTATLPEPGSILALATGLVGLVLRRRTK